MSDWQPIETAPAGPMDVLLYRTRADWGAPVPDGVRYDIGYWDGHFFYHGTNHRVFEFGDKPGHDECPTHWQPLPTPPTKGTTP